MDTGNYSDSLYALSLLDNNTTPYNWELVTPTLPNSNKLRRYGHSAVLDSTSDSILVFGGFVPLPHVQKEKSSDVWVFNIEESVWSLLRINRAVPGLVFHKAVSLGRYMVVFGGSPQDDNQATCFSKKMFVFDTGCMDWTSLAPPIARDIATPRYGHAAALYHGTMLVVGGFNGKPLNDVILYSPPRDDCTRIPRRGGFMSGVYDECEVLQHCVRCNKRCKPVDKCRSRMSQCSVCYHLQHCSECTLWGCEWCVEDASCRSRDSGNPCGVQSPSPWWGDKGTLLHNPSQCQAEDTPPGLHWIRYIDPINTTHPDHVSIVKKADVHLLYSRDSSLPFSDKKEIYWGYLQGFINITNPKADHNIRVSYMNGMVAVYAGMSRYNATRVMAGKEGQMLHDHCYNYTDNPSPITP